MRSVRRGVVGWYVAILLASATQAVLAEGPTLSISIDFANKISSVAIFDSTGAEVCRSDWGALLPVGRDAKTDGMILPVRLIAFLRDGALNSSSAERKILGDFLTQRMGPHARSEALSIPPDAFATLEIGYGKFIQWCGTGIRKKECVGDCSSPCGIGKEKCCSCGCYQEETSLKLGP